MPQQNQAAGKMKHSEKVFSASGRRSTAIGNGSNLCRPRYN